MERLNVLQLCEHFGGRGSSLHGVARSFQWWLPAFDATRYNVILCSRKGRDKAAEQMEACGLRPLYLGYGTFDPRNLLALLRLLRSERIDILHAHGYGACTWGRVAGWLLHIPVVVHERCNYVTVPWYQRPVEWLLGPGTRYALAVSESSRQFCIRKRHMRSEVVQVLYNGILMDDVRIRPEAWRVAARRELGVGPEDLLLGVVGRLEAHKGHVDLFRALSLLGDAGARVRVWVIGDGVHGEVLRSQAQSLGGRVQFLGFRTDVRDLIQCMDVQVFPSHMEGTPNTLYEALAVGNAIVASRADGQGEILTDGQDALLYAPGDVTALSACLRRVLADPDLRALLRAGARALAPRYDGRNTIRAMQDLYERIMGERRGRPAGTAKEVAG